MCTFPKLLGARWHNLPSQLLDLVLPRRCAGCDRQTMDTEAFCPACEASLLVAIAGCHRCGDPQAATVCDSCGKCPPPFALARAALIYGGQLAHAITRLKYEGALHLAPALGALLCETAQQLAPIDRVVPVPLHRRQLLSRGFNQAALLAAPVAHALNAPLCTGSLRRIRHTARQVGLAQRQRQRNVEGAFSAQPARVAGCRILLVDDVLTTGATASACSAALLDAGAEQVLVLTLARAIV